MVQILGLWERIVNIHRAVELLLFCSILPIKDKFYKESCNFGCKALLCRNAAIKVTSNIGLDKVCDRSPQTLFKIKKKGLIE